MRSISVIKRVTVVLIVLVAAILVLWRIIAMSENLGPTWHGLTIGSSTTEQVVSQLGSPSRIEDEGDDIVYFYQGKLEWAAHRIVMSRNIVKMIEEDMSVYFPEETRLTRFIDQYGIPDYVTWSREDPSLRIAIFTQAGVVVEATANPLSETQVTRAFYTLPQSLTQIQSQFANVVSFTDPFPSSDVLEPENPWALELKTYRP
jgi:hypothetical protein